MIRWPDLKFPPINLWSLPRWRRDYTKEESECPECDDTGVVYEGGISMNPEIDNKVSCQQCKEKDNANETY